MKDQMLQYDVKSMFGKNVSQCKQSSQTYKPNNYNQLLEFVQDIRILDAPIQIKVLGMLMAQWCQPAQ